MEDQELQEGGAPELERRRSSKYFIRGGKSYVQLESGQLLQIKRVAPLLISQVQKRVKRPVPPLKVYHHEDGTTFEEFDYEDKRYLAAQSEYGQALEAEYRKLILKRGVVYNLSEEEEGQVEELRQFWREEYGEELDPDNRYCFLAYILLEAAEDYGEVAEAVLQRTQPTEGAIADAIEAFQPALSR